MTTFTDKQINAWKWHSTSEVDGILADTAVNITPENYKRKVDTFRVLRAAGFDEQVENHLPTFFRNIAHLGFENPLLAAQVRAVTLNLVFEVSQTPNSTYARLAEISAPH